MIKKSTESIVICLADDIRVRKIIRLDEEKRENVRGFMCYIQMDAGELDGID